MTPDSARDSLYRRLYAAWPEWSMLGEADEFHGLELWREGRMERRPLDNVGGSAFYRVNMGLAA